jgi:flagellin
MFRVNTNVMSINGQRNLFRTQQALTSTMGRLSSGLRIVHAGDDPAGLSMSEGMRSQIAGARQANRNISQAISMLQTADGGYEQIGDMLTRLKELAVQAADSTLNNANRSAIQLEVTQLLLEMERIAQSTTYNAMTLINAGSTPTASVVLSFYVGDGSLGGPTFEIIGFSLRGISAATNGISVAGTLFTIGAVSFGTLNEAAAVVDNVNAAINAVSSLRTSLGAVVNRLERAQANIQTMLENTQNAESIIRDADFAAETAALTRAQILVQAGTSILQQANNLPQNALLLLQG